MAENGITKTSNLGFWISDHGADAHVGYENAEDLPADYPCLVNWEKLDKLLALALGPDGATIDGGTF